MADGRHSGARADVPRPDAALAPRTDEVRQRCRTELQSRADALDAARAAATGPDAMEKAA